MIDTGIRYIGNAKVSTGIVAQQTNGRYRGTTQAPKFNQTLTQFVFDYKVGERTTMNAAIGYTTREQPGFAANEKTSAVTGSLGYTRQLSPKTSVYVQYYRIINNYIAAGGSQLDNNFAAGFNWQPTPKLSIAGNYGWIRSQVSGQVNFGQIQAGRADRYRSPRVTMNYLPVRWLTLSPFYRTQKRQSNIADFQFDAKIVGIDVLAKF